MNTFKKLVTNVSTGVTPVSRLKFYAKRLAQETATRRIATILMIGLLLFQALVFVFPAKPTQASANDVIPGGITNTSNQGVVNAFKTSGPNPNPGWGDNASQLLAQVGASEQDVLNGAANQNICKSQHPGLLSMGREAGAGSWLFPGHNNIFVGPASSRWLQDCFAGEILNVKVQGSAIGVTGAGANQWYQVGIIYECGNLVFIPTTPPAQTISCTNLSATPSAVLVNQPITLTGQAQGENVPLADMIYRVYKGTDLSYATPLVQQLQSDGVQNDNGTFIDPDPKQFQTDQPGTYSIILLVQYDTGNGQKSYAPGSAVGACQKQVTVGSEQTIVCENLAVNPLTVPGGQPITMTGTAKQVDGNNPNEPADFTYYLREKKADGSFDDTTVDANGKHSIDAYGLTPNPSGVYTDTRPPQGNPNDTFFMPANLTNQAKTYQVFMRVFWRGHVPISDAFSVPACAKLVTVPPAPQQFVCESLTANPTSGDVPLEVAFNVKGAVNNTAVQGFDFDFGDSAKQSVNTDQTTAATSHTYTKGGKYTATALMRTAAGTTTAIPACTVVITVNDTGFAKIVANLTLLTSDGKPTDANGTVARAGDKLQYTIGIQNKGGDTVKGFVFDDDITDILQYATIVDAGGAKTVTTGGTTKLVWDPVDVPAAATSTKMFTAQLKNPIPFTAQKNTDLPGYNDCQLSDTFHNVTVNTPLGVDINKQIECTVQTLPQTGSSSGWVLFLMAFFAAASLFLLFRNRLLRRELELVETLTEGTA